MKREKGKISRTCLLGDLKRRREIRKQKQELVCTPAWGRESESLETNAEEIHVEWVCKKIT